MCSQFQSHGAGKFPFLRVASAFLIIFLLLSAGCTRPAGTPETDRAVQDTPQPVITTPSVPQPTITNNKIVAATAQKPDATKIIVTSVGGPDADQLMELEASITDSTGTVRTQTMGSRLGTTPVQNGGTITIYGPFAEEAHVVVIGHFADGTHKDLLNIRI